MRELIEMTVGGFLICLLIGGVMAALAAPFIFTLWLFFG